MKRIELNGINFEVVKDLPTSINYDDIFEAYGRPSNTKIRVWNDWKDWQQEAIATDTFKDLHIGIHAAGCQTFSITGHGYDGNGTRYDFFITRDHDRVKITPRLS